MDNKINFFLSGICVGYVMSRILDYEFKKLYLNKLITMNTRIEKLEDFRFSLYEKNLLLGEKREWDEISSEISDHLTDEEEEEM
jgi:hypothetical protein